MLDSVEVNLMGKITVLQQVIQEQRLDIKYGACPLVISQLNTLIVLNNKLIIELEALKSYQEKLLKDKNE